MNVAKSKKIVCISDTHGYHEQVYVPSGDILICAGDVTRNAGRQDLRNFLTWLEKQPCPHKVLVAGNHDWAFEKWPDLAQQMVRDIAPSVHYLQDSGIELLGLRIWGSPVQPRFLDWAFNRDSGDDIRRHWDLIPNDTNVLVTHGPPHGVLDAVGKGEQLGCQDLRSATHNRLKDLKLHVFGHIHYGYGIIHNLNNTTYVNAAVCTEGYKPMNAPIVVEL